MDEFKDIEERPRQRVKGLGEKKHELMPEVSSDSTVSILNPVQTAVQSGGLKPSTNMEVHRHGQMMRGCFSVLDDRKLRIRI